MMNSGIEISICSGIPNLFLHSKNCHLVGDDPDLVIKRCNLCYTY